jgi:hypothetical protein
MTIKIWIPAQDKVAAECEKMFQNGGPNVYRQSRVGPYSRLAPVTVSAKAALTNEFAGTAIYARRKQGRKYVWMTATAKG